MENKLIRKALEESENRYRQLIEFLSDMILVHSEGRIIFINPAGCHLLGASSPGDIIGKAFIDFVHPDYKDTVRERFRHVIVESRESKSFEDKLIRLNGDELIIETVISPFRFEDEWALLIVGHDITARKRSEEALRRSEERFKSMVENLNGYIYSVFFMEGRPVSSYHSPRCMRITGYSPEEYAADPDLWINMVYPEDRNMINDFFMNLSRERQRTNAEHRITHKNGSIRWISNTFTVTTNTSGELQRLDGFIIDITDRKTAEAQLNDQYILLQRLIDTIPHPIYHKNTDEIILTCNAAFANFLGKERHEIIGNALSSVATEEVSSKFQKLIPDDINKPCAQTYEEKIRYADGQFHDVIINEAAFIISGSNVPGVVGVITDITKLKKTQEELRETLGQLSEMNTIINKSQAIVFLWHNTAGWPVEFVSDNIEQFGYNAQDFISSHLYYNDIVFEGDRNRVVSEVQRFVAKRLPEFSQEYRIITRHGELKWVEDHIWVKKNDQGEITHFQGIIYDITVRKQAERLLKDSEERYRTLAENSYDLICELNNNLSFQYISPNVYEMLGYKPEELKDRSILEFVHISDMAIVIKELRKNVGRAVLRLKHANGEWIWFESAGRKFKTSTGEIKGVIVSRDISERKKLEQQMVHSEKLMAIGEMSAMIAHEFRNALTSVKMIIQLLSESSNLNRGEKDSFKVAVNSIHHMENIVQQLLNFAHPAPVELQIDDLNNIIKSCIPFVQMQANKKGITLKYELDPDLPPMVVHSTSIKEMIINLLLNGTQAFNSIERDERYISISTKKLILEKSIKDFDFGIKSRHMGIRRKAQDGQEIVIHKGTEVASIEIEDNGAGIDHEIITRIFEPFFTTKRQGSGLGLSIVKRTINAHGGIITVDSRKGQGTKFSIYLPLKI